MAKLLTIKEKKEKKKNGQRKRVKKLERKETCSLPFRMEKTISAGMEEISEINLNMC